MDQSYSESDVSLSPSQILERLQVLRQLQLLQRGKLQKQRLEYQESSEISTSATEIVSHFSNSTSYNTFRSLLETPHDSSIDGTPRRNASNITPKVKEKDLIEGVSVLNLSQESEFIINTPTSGRSRISASSKNEVKSPANSHSSALSKKQISLDDMPILSPKKDFEALIIEKLQKETTALKSKSPKQNPLSAALKKKPFLRRGAGTSRYGLKKKDFVIQNTKSLPWRQKHLHSNAVESPVSKLRKENRSNNNKNKVNVEILVTQPDEPELKRNIQCKETEKEINDSNNTKSFQQISNNNSSNSQSSDNHAISSNLGIQRKLELPKGKHPILAAKGKTWASVFTKEQNDFLRQLKQSDYYKNFASPTKSTVSDASCDETLSKVRNQKEVAEQNMFELLESKVSHESFSMENSFFNKFLRKSKLECSGESTPIVMQQCLANNPDLMHIYSGLKHKNRNNDTQSDAETCNSEYTDCCSETCSSVSSSCSCKTVEETNDTIYTEKNKENIPQQKKGIMQRNKNGVVKTGKKVQVKEVESKDCTEIDNVTVNNNDIMKANMVEMNAKLIATSELLKERLRELEDEIETFRRENTNLNKMREDIDTERQKFYEEKNMLEQKFNEEKILAEYYLAEEKEKLTKQKQMYERYVREIRGRLNKKDKDEVINLKKEISDLKEEIRLKDAKSTSTIARLRNQIKIMEKEKKDLLEEVEKQKKENRRIQHSNDITRRMTNIKYLEQINKKLSHITTKETQSEVNLDNNVKYKAFEIERQSRPRKIQTTGNGLMRARAKSVPNLNVTSRYAKYFSQRDAVSDFERNQTVNVEPEKKHFYPSDNESEDAMPNERDDSGSYKDYSDHEDANNLEKLYLERFQSTSPKSTRSNTSNENTSFQNNNFQENPDRFFIKKSTTNKDSRASSHSISPYNNLSGSNSRISKSPVSILSHRSSDQRSPRDLYPDIQYKNNSSEHVSSISQSSNKPRNQSRSPISILTNRSSSNQKPATVIHVDQYRDTLNVTPEVPTSKTSLTKTNLNPTEIKKPDGSKELRFPNGNVKFISPDGKYSKFVYYNGDIKENFYNEGRIKYFYAETKTYHTTHADGLEVLEFPDGQVEKRYKDGSTEIRLPNGSVRYYDPKNEHVREEWRFPDGAALTVSAGGDQRIVFPNGQVEVHAKDHKRREFPDGTVKLVYNDGTSETRYASGRVRIKDKHGNLIMDSAPG